MTSDKTNLVHVKQLGLAAYMKMKGCNLLRVNEGKAFVFESEKSFSEWRIEYTNSCCSRHDAEVCELRNFLR